MVHDLADAPKGRALVIVYNRVSAEEQAEGDGLDRQRRNADACCVRIGVVVDVRLEDIGLSAFTGGHVSRGQMGRILTGIAEGTIPNGSILVVENLDRISRLDVFDALELFLRILNNGIVILTSKDDCRYTRDGDSMKRMMTVVMSVMHLGRSNSESEIKSKRVAEVWSQKHQRAREEKTPHGKRCPAWIELTPEGKYKCIPDRQKWIEWICRKAIEGWGRRRIVKALIARDVAVWLPPTKKGRKRFWNESYIHRILTSGEAKGEYHPSNSPKGGTKVYKEVIDNYYPAAVDAGLYERARAATLRRSGGGGPKGKFGNIFQNFCRCGACGKGMTLEDKGVRSRGPALVCRRATLGDCDHKQRYEYKLLELQIIFCLGERANSLLQSSRENIDAIMNELALKKRRECDLKARIENVLFHMELSTDVSLVTKLRNLRTELTNLHFEMKEHNNKISEANHYVESNAPHESIAFYRRLGEIPKEERSAARSKINQSLRASVDRIVFLMGKVEVEFSDGKKGLIFKGTGKRSPRPNPGHFAKGSTEGRQGRVGDRKRIEAIAVEPSAQ